jgi:hypothetical protein
MMEHRLSRRVDIAISAGLRFADGTAVMGLATNISTGGVFVTTSVHLAKHHYADLVMRVVTPRGEPTLRMSALVVHRHSSGIGLMFRRLDEQAMQTLSWLVAFLSGQPQHAPRPAREAARLTT